VSFLTKLFVVLLVVLSLLFTAATVVFVNRVGDFKTVAQQTENTLRAEKLRAEQLEREATVAKQAAVDQMNQLTTTNSQLNQQLTAAQADGAKKDAGVADLRNQLALQTLALTQSTEAAKASETQRTTLLAQLTDLRKSADELLRRNVDLNQTLAETQNRLDVTTREWRNVQEQLAEAQQQAGKLTAALKDAGVRPEQAVAAAGTRAGAPAINGVINAVRSIAGIQYATISVGSADQVAKGMRFSVIDRQSGSFLGYLTVDSVEPNEATGRLQGPRIGEVKRGNEVRTQL